MSKNKKINIGIMYSPRTGANIPMLQRFTHSFGGSVLVHDEFRRGLDVLILPDNVGVNPTAKNTYGFTLYLDECSYFRSFYTKFINEYIEKRVDVIGIGHSAAYLYSQHLKLPSLIDSKGSISLIEHTKDDEMNYINRFSSDNIHGIMHIEDLHMLLLTLSEEVKDVSKVEAPKEEEQIRNPNDLPLEDGWSNWTLFTKD